MEERPWLKPFVLALVLSLSGCAGGSVASSETSEGGAPSLNKLSQKVRDEHGYGCGPVEKADLVRFLDTADFESQRTIHDHFSVVGCSVTGKISMNGELSTFVFDYGGIMYLDDGRILACGESCCEDGYEYCTWQASPGER